MAAKVRERKRFGNCNRIRLLALPWKRRSSGPDTRVIGNAIRRGRFVPTRLMIMHSHVNSNMNTAVAVNTKKQNVD